MKVQITNRWNASVLFEANVNCSAYATDGVRLGLAVKLAVKAGANLAGAYLRGAYLAGANLTGANLTDAYLAGANLTDANLTDAYLRGANLAGANLRGTNLADANLAGAYLRGTKLTGANLAGARWTDGAIIKREPIQIYGLAYPVTILDDRMQIGCELHSLAEWEAFDDERISKMDGVAARRFWRMMKDALLAIAKADGRGVKSEAEAA